MPERFAIYAGEPLAAALAGHDGERSARINQIAADWAAFVAAEAPEFTEAEWSAVLDALNGTFLDDETTLRHCWGDVEDAEGLGGKWGIDQAALAQRVRRLRYPELLALREIVRRFWQLAGGHDRPDALRLAGAKITQAAAGE